MLQLRPVCENCGKDLPNHAADAMICSFECTFCADCVTHVLQNVCPTCGGGFEKRPSRPAEGFRPDNLLNFPAETQIRLRPVNLVKFKEIQDHYVNVDPRKR